MDDTLLILAIGPVQDFIATARTSHDLEFGSWMLSELSKAAAKALFDQGAKLIFPAPENETDLQPGSPLSVANKILALVQGDSEPLVQVAEQAVRARLWDLAEGPLAQLKSGEIHARARQQIENGLLEFYWASAPVDKDQSYKTARSYAEAALAARKRTRDFAPWPGVPGTAKSSLDGFREEVFVIQKEQSDASTGEVLSGVDWVKRKGTRQGRPYQSTSDFAAAPFRQGLGQLDTIILKELKALLKQYTDETETDGAYYFVERLVRFIENEDSKQSFVRDYDAVFQSHGVKRRVEPYYAVLVADGDSMGKLIDHQETKEAHQMLSQALSRFAGKAKLIIEKTGGQAVYTGGDDILAYLPLHTALDCIEHLDQTFSKALAEFAYNGVNPTLSGGLAIAHHLTPLSDVLNAARFAERKAKNRPQKHALAIVVTRRSGGETMVVGGMEDMLPRLKRLVILARDGSLSRGAAYELRELAEFLQDTGLDEKVFAREAVRIISRKRESGGADMDKAAQEEMTRWLEGAQGKVSDLASEMIVAQEFAKAQKLAHPQKEVQK